MLSSTSQENAAGKLSHCCLKYFKYLKQYTERERERTQRRCGSLKKVPLKERLTAGHKQLKRPSNAVAKPVLL